MAQNIRVLGSEIMKEHYDKTPNGDFSPTRSVHFAQQVVEFNFQRMRRFKSPGMDNFPAKTQESQQDNHILSRLLMKYYTIVIPVSHVTVVEKVLIH